MKKKISWKNGIGISGALILFLILGLVSVAGEDGSGSRGGGRFHLMGATYMSRSNPFFDVLHESIQEVLEGNGDRMISRDPAQDQEKQNEQILDMIEEGIEVLFLNPVDWEAVEPALVACREAGIPVINVDTRIKDTSYAVSVIESDNYKAGQQCAEDMMTRIKRARIIILEYPGQASVCDRVEGFLDTIAGQEGYQVVRQVSASGEMEVGAEVMAELLEEGVEFDVIFGGNDPMALGALSALQQRGRYDTALIYGVDGSPDSKAMMKLGYVTGTSAQSPKEIGKVAAQMAYRYLDGEPVEEYVRIEPVMITQENIDEFEMNSWQ